ncbi:flagellar assembly protein FliW [Demequina capsici]|uniref:Flagellar assembly protein FliW n=1 Tax=Demequina capsici TaxID=3075620 RepID=A0AA96FD83_9MICO|nr:flagellar assembly protein FliW [Demequina sp. PMTSA13]WNM27392.1 flagellar assembly protein FliW [Demequina sp. PMTSA13]
MTTIALALDAAGVRVQQLPDVLTFIEAPPGMASLTTFRLAAIDEFGYLFTLRSAQQEGVRLFAVSPSVYFPAYAPRVSEEVRAALGLDDAAEPALLAIVNPGEGEATTVNLFAPVVVDPVTGNAVQVILDSDEWPLRAPLVADAA